MTYDEISRFFGSRCLVRMRCRACLSGHMISGRILRGRHAGQILLKGHTFDAEDIEGIWAGTPPLKPQRKPLLQMLFGRRLFGSGSPV
jgi:hypothetical protein